MSPVVDTWDVRRTMGYQQPAVVLSEAVTADNVQDVVIRRLTEAALDRCKKFVVEVGDPATGEYQVWGATGLPQRGVRKLLGPHFLTVRLRSQRFWVICEPKDAGKVMGLQ